MKYAAACERSSAELDCGAVEIVSPARFLICYFRAAPRNKQTAADNLLTQLDQQFRDGSFSPNINLGLCLGALLARQPPIGSWMRSRCARRPSKMRTKAAPAVAGWPPACSCRAACFFVHIAMRRRAGLSAARVEFDARMMRKQKSIFARFPSKREGGRWPDLRRPRMSFGAGAERHDRRGPGVKAAKDKR